MCIRDRDPSLEETERSLGRHMLIAQATGNARAILMVRSLMDDVARMPRPIPDLTTGPKRPGVEEHARIVAAIADGGSEEAPAAMLAHLEATIARDLGGPGLASSSRAEPLRAASRSEALRLLSVLRALLARLG